uniref:Uncharacterized protein n=1 Tax=Calcidiscus leptoporus TaxID=127549 RepID=A0A7S0IJ35_9EUKA|mmetsp:Transcript_10732/g.24905  ORF Transcript_10732/g.24905 Transcript_10732/m.24905 type:complete len:134 (+) Transcript_10732:580-981(+)
MLAVELAAQPLLNLTINPPCCSYVILDSLNRKDSPVVLKCKSTRQITLARAYVDYRVASRMSSYIVGKRGEPDDLVHFLRLDRTAQRSVHCTLLSAAPIFVACAVALNVSSTFALVELAWEPKCVDSCEKCKQ